MNRALSIANSGVNKTKIDESLEARVVLPQDDIEIITDLGVLAIYNIDSSITTIQTFAKSWQN